MKSKAGSAALALLVVFGFMAYWTVRRAGRMYDAFRLLTQGEMVQAEVLRARTRFIESWPYRVEYRFAVDGTAYEEPRHRGTGRWARDIGAPISRSLWHGAERTGALPVLYLPDRPAANMPLDGETWLLLQYVQQVAALAFFTALLVLVAVGGLMEVAGEGAGDLKAALQPFGCLIAGSIYGGVLVEFLFRVGYFALGLEDMDGLDLASSALAVVANGAMPVALAVAFTKAKLLIRSKRS